MTMAGIAHGKSEDRPSFAPLDAKRLVTRGFMALRDVLWMRRADRWSVERIMARLGGD